MFSDEDHLLQVPWVSRSLATFPSWKFEIWEEASRNCLKNMETSSVSFLATGGPIDITHEKLIQLNSAPFLP
jgi:hypothetical protein